MGDVVDPMLLEKLGRDDPRTVGNDLVHPFAMAHRLGAFGTTQDSETLAFVCFLITSYADNQVRIGEGILGLFELPHVAGKEAAVSAIAQGQEDGNNSVAVATAPRI